MSLTREEMLNIEGILLEGSNRQDPELDIKKDLVRCGCCYGIIIERELVRAEKPICGRCGCAVFIPYKPKSKGQAREDQRENEEGAQAFSQGRRTQEEDNGRGEEGSPADPA